MSKHYDEKRTEVLVPLMQFWETVSGGNPIVMAWVGMCVSMGDRMATAQRHMLNKELSG